MKKVLAALLILLALGASTARADTTVVVLGTTPVKVLQKNDLRYSLTAQVASGQGARCSALEDLSNSFNVSSSAATVSPVSEDLWCSAVGTSAQLTLTYSLLKSTSTTALVSVPNGTSVQVLPLDRKRSSAMIEAVNNAGAGGDVYCGYTCPAPSSGQHHLDDSLEQVLNVNSPWPVCCYAPSGTANVVVTYEKN
jgi:hypothetical protein